MHEGSIQNKIRLACAKLAILFRINVGQAWTGERIIQQGRNVLLINARPFKTGVPAGYPDLSGWKPLVITPEMVGKTVAVFTYIEVKTPTGKVSKVQKNFHDVANNAGAIGGVARSPEEAIKILNKDLK